MNETPVRATGVHGGAESRASNWPISACARPPAPPRFPPAARKSRNERSQAASPSAHAPHWRRRGAPFRGAQGADLKGWLGDEAEPHLSAPTCFPCRIEASLCLISPPPLRPYEAGEKSPIGTAPQRTAGSDAYERAEARRPTACCPGNRAFAGARVRQRPQGPCVGATQFRGGVPARVPCAPNGTLGLPCVPSVTPESCTRYRPRARRRGRPPRGELDLRGSFSSPTGLPPWKL